MGWCGLVTTNPFPLFYSVSLIVCAFVSQYMVSTIEFADYSLFCWDYQKLFVLREKTVQLFICASMQVYLCNFPVPIVRTIIYFALLPSTDIWYNLGHSLFIIINIYFCGEFRFASFPSISLADSMWKHIILENVFLHTFDISHYSNLRYWLRLPLELVLAKIFM